MNDDQPGAPPFLVWALLGLLCWLGILAAGCWALGVPLP